MRKDTTNLRSGAQFEIEVFPRVYWVPANALGRTRYTDEDIYSMLALAPEIKRQKIDNLYEALQLYQASKFKGRIDNVRVLEEDTGVLWVFHKSGFDAVRTNEGCCAADSNWLSYVLNGKYEKIGCFGWYQPDGNGHIINYIKSDGWYYFMDMMMQRYDSVQSTAAEDGNINGYKNNNAFACIYKTKGFDEYIDFCLTQYDIPPVLFYKTADAECICIGNEYAWQESKEIKGWNLAQKSNRLLFYDGSVEVLFSKDNNVFAFRKSKAIEPDWSLVKGFDWKM
jgi:hypothetical protein